MQPREETSTPQSVGAEVAVLVGAGLLAAMARLRPLRNPDVLWQLTSGEAILAQGGRLRVDLYSFLFRGRALLDHEWAFEAAVARVHRSFGMEGIWWINLAFVVALVVASTWLARALVPPALPRVIAASLAVIGIAARTELRAETLPFLAVLVAHGLRRRADSPDGGRRVGPAAIVLRLSPVVCAALSAPFNALAILVAIVPALHALWSLVAVVRAPDGETRRAASSELAIDVAITIATIAAAELFAPGLIAYVMASRAAVSFYDHVLEGGAPLHYVIASGDPTPFLASALALVACVGLARSVRQGRASPTDALLVFALTVPGLFYVRFAALPLIAALPWAIAGVATLIAPGTARLGRAVSLATGTLTLAIGTYVVTADLGLTTIVGFDWATQPVTAVNYLRFHLPNASLFHSYNFGAYLIYARYPPRGVLIDARSPMLYPDEFARRYYQAITDVAAFDEWAKTAPFDTVLLQRSHAGTRVLRAHMYESPEWKLVWYDHIAVVFVRAELAP